MFGGQKGFVQGFLVYPNKIPNRNNVMERYGTKVIQMEFSKRLKNNLTYFVLVGN